MQKKPAPAEHACREVVSRTIGTAFDTKEKRNYNLLTTFLLTYDDRE